MIVVKGRQMTIPKLERYIGTAYDDNSEMRIFRIDRTATNGVDLSGLSFRLDLEYENGEKDTAYLEAEVQEEYILLMWEIINSVLQVPGTVFVNIRATDINGSIKWSSFKGAFYVEDNINTPGSYTGKLTELEQAEARIDAKIELMDDAEQQRIANEKVRQSEESARQSAESERQQAEQKREELAGTFTDAIKGAETAAKHSESWAVGGTGTRSGENSDNSKYYAMQSGAEADRAERAALLAEQYVDIIPPKFHLDLDTMELIQDTEAQGIEFSLDENKNLLFEYV